MRENSHPLMDADRDSFDRNQATANALPPISEKAARLITDVLYPHWVVIVLLGLVTAHGTTNTIQFLLWWPLSVFFVAVVPYGFIIYALKGGRISDRNITRAGERTFPFTTAILSFGVGALLMVLLGAPREVLGVTLGAMVGLLIALPLAPRLKLSIHTAGVAGTVTILTILFGPWSLLLTPFVPLVGWAKIRIDHHTPAQVVAGVGIGTAVAGAVFTAVITLL